MSKTESDRSYYKDKCISQVFIFMIISQDAIENGSEMFDDETRPRDTFKMHSLSFHEVERNKHYSKRQCIKDGSDIGNKNKALFSPVPSIRGV